MAVLSGVLAFLGYTVRVESVWIWLAFMLAYLPFAGAGEARARALRRFALAGTTALLGYATYASVVHPLADPRSYLAFAASLAQSAREGVHAGNLVFVVGGMLWLGAVFALPRLRGSRVVRFGVLWLLLAGLPSWALIASDSAVQTRMLIGLVPPWSFCRRRAGRMCCEGGGDSRPSAWRWCSCWCRDPRSTAGSSSNRVSGGSSASAQPCSCRATSASITCRLRWRRSAHRCSTAARGPGS